MVSAQAGLNQAFNPEDPRAVVALATVDREKNAAMEKRKAEYSIKYDKYAKLAQAASGNGKLSEQEQIEFDRKQRERLKKEQREVYMFAGGLILVVCVLCVLVTFGMLKLTEWMEKQNQLNS